MGFFRAGLVASLAGLTLGLARSGEYVVTDSQTKEEGKKFLAEKAKDPNVKVLKSGLMYEVLNAGTGDKHPTASTPCDCHYAGTLIDGTIFSGFAVAVLWSAWEEVLAIDGPLPTIPTSNPELCRVLVFAVGA